MRATNTCTTVGRRMGRGRDAWRGFTNTEQERSMAKRNLSRRQFVGATAGTVVGAAAGGALVGAPVAGQGAQAQGNAPAATDQDLILTNGRIHTMDARNTVARTVSIRDGRIATVGDTT